MFKHLATAPLKTILQVKEQELAMKIDTGAAVSLVSEETVNSSFYERSLYSNY